MTELVPGDVFEWWPLMARAFRLAALVIPYSFFVDCCVSSMTGAMKE